MEKFGAWCETEKSVPVFLVAGLLAGIHPPPSAGCRSVALLLLLFLVWPGWHPIAMVFRDDPRSRTHRHPCCVSPRRPPCVVVVDDGDVGNGEKNCCWKMTTRRIDSIHCCYYCCHYYYSTMQSRNWNSTHSISTVCVVSLSVVASARVFLVLSVLWRPVSLLPLREPNVHCAAALVALDQTRPLPHAVLSEYPTPGPRWHRWLFLHDVPNERWSFWYDDDHVVVVVGNYYYYVHVVAKPQHVLYRADPVLLPSPPVGPRVVGSVPPRSGL